MICFPNCKINLGLFITHKRIDGYHDLETIFYPVPWKDVLEIIHTDWHTKLYLSGKEIVGNSTDNLVWKAFELLKKKFPDRISEIEIHLHKNLPMGGGLGGGSSDGALMLRLLNDFFRLNLANEELALYALQLGSDCPFFIYDTPQFAKGRGEIMQNVNIDLSTFSLQLICPDLHVSTANAFDKIQPKPASFNLINLESIPVSEWKNVLKNDFEVPIFTQFPILKSIKEQLYAQGAIFASMSGSGATIFALFEKGKSAQIDLDIHFEQFLVK